MAVYKLFATKDATIYSGYPLMNTGLDEILEFNKVNNVDESGSNSSRILIQFSDDDINTVVTNYATASFKCYLRLFLANAQTLPTDFTIIANPISGSWDNGTGRYQDNPQTENGVSWQYQLSSGSSQWSTSSFVDTTASFQVDNKGGGTWYTSSFSTQSFGIYTDKDINIDVTNIILQFVSSSIQNNGIILRISGSLEFDENYSFIVNYFSRDTNTVFPPLLEFKWDDSSFVTGSPAVAVGTTNLIVSLGNNKGEYNENEIYRFRVNVRDQFPVRTFTTSSIYTTPKYLPSSSYYAVKDVKSDLTIIDFDSTYTKLSYDGQGNYFDIYMNGLEPQRYYKILIKTVISGSTIVYDNEQFFKIV